MASGGRKMEKFDYKKEYKDLYLPKTKPMLIDVPRMKFICVQGKGNPNEMINMTIHIQKNY